MLNNPTAAVLMQDAREAQATAERLLDAGDWRDAAEKAWLATRNATAAAVLDVTGVNNSGSTGIEAGLRRLSRQRGGEWARLREDYKRVVRYLHSDAFYHGIYQNDIGARVRGVADYIRRAEELAAAQGTPPP